LEPGGPLKLLSWGGTALLLWLRLGLAWAGSLQKDSPLSLEVKAGGGDEVRCAAIATVEKVAAVIFLALDPVGIVLR
jgi:hypothetical protein